MERRARTALVAGSLVLVVLLVLALVLRLALPPERVAGLVLGQVGRALDLEITASGAAEYRLRGAPMLVVRDLVARQPGADVAILRADRIHVALPWSTLRARGAELTATRLELDAPVLDLPALQAWLATRPPGETRIPTLTDGLRVVDGRIDNHDWDVDGLRVDVPSLFPERPLRARLRGRYIDPPLRVPVDLAVALVRPAALLADAPSGFATRGHITIQRNDWQVPASVALSGPLRLGEDSLQVAPARIGLAGRFQSLPRGADATELPFSLGLHGPLRFDEATWTLAPAGVALRGEALVPDFDARGAVALGRRLVLQLRGRIAAWPEAWPALPPPIGQSSSPLPFELDYAGDPGLSGIARLRLQRDETRFDGRFRAFEVAGWIDAREQGSPLPPIDGTIATPRMEIAGAQLESVEIVIDEPTIGGPAEASGTLGQTP
jgi:hypothetical protein